ncbi:MAG TPA: hypothetical protein K8W01_12510 [Methylorubrum populi]|uniref:DUF6883 domain-containing protein n=1 Tax=Methylorubrum populi TaxID=223967 RepID=A0A921JF81_9HYPH|nr:hypothetical protein [Methylorubrum populi]
MKTFGGRGPLRVPRDKIVHYLLNADHPKGGPKARFFLSFGFDPAMPGVMAGALIEHFNQNPGVLLPETPTAGERMVVEGPLNSPDSRHPHVRSIWQRDEDPMAWRLITAVPLVKR